MRIDPAGRLWVFSDAPRPDWHDAWTGIAVPSGTVEMRVSALPPEYSQYDTFVEIIDPARRRVVASARLDAHVFAILDYDRVATFVETDVGIPIVTIRRLTLTGER
jgi:hypothetical protein